MIVDEGAARVLAAATHPVLSGAAFENLFTDDSVSEVFGGENQLV